jgi:hypothetical protein
MHSCIRKWIVNQNHTTGEIKSIMLPLTYSIRSLTANPLPATRIKLAELIISTGLIVPQKMQLHMIQPTRIIKENPIHSTWDSRIYLIPSYQAYATKIPHGIRTTREGVGVEGVRFWPRSCAPWASAARSGRRAPRQSAPSSWCLGGREGIRLGGSERRRRRRQKP